jgi:hypothetical protein
MNQKIYTFILMYPYVPGTIYMAGADEVLYVWKEWSIHVLVLLSLTLQVTLLILAEFRRRVNSGILRFFVWSAYMLADGTAIYVLGHMTATSRSPEHGLMAFWAPFVLLHLGGQDNITAYAIEDNRLWLRHLQTLAVQVAAAGYIIYVSVSSTVHSSALLWWATILMFVVGVTKYGERVWALRCAGSRNPMGKNYRTFEYRSEAIECQYYLDTILSPSRGPWDTEAYLLMAHRMLQVPKELLKGPIAQDRAGYPLASYMCEKDVYMVVEMQLSLMHDVFYTKTEMIHSNLYGLCIRILPAVATTTAFLLFHILITLRDHGKEDKVYNRLDVAVTYVLSVGAIVLETTSLLRSMFSSWTCPLLVRWSRDHCGMEDHTLYNRIASILTSLRRLVHAAEWRRKYWSRSMGQHNLLQMGARSRGSSVSKISRWMGFEDWWNTLAYSWSTPVSSLIEELLVKQMFVRESRQSRIPSSRGGEASAEVEEDEEEEDEEDEEEDEEDEEAEDEEDEEEEEETEEEEEEEEEVSDDKEELEVLVRELDNLRDKEEEAGAKEGLEGQPDKDDHHLFDSMGRAQLKRWGLYNDDLTWSIEDRVLVWHIATSVYLDWWYEMTRSTTKQAPMAEAIEALSNYMVFLLAARPYMLSPTASRNGYIEMCYGLITKGPPYSSAEGLANKLRSYGIELLKHNRGTGTYSMLHWKYGFKFDFIRRSYFGLILETGCKLGAKLILNTAVDTQEVIAQVWVEALCYAAKQCSRESHARQLGNGGELITIAAILVRYMTEVFGDRGHSGLRVRRNIARATGRTSF